MEPFVKWAGGKRQISEVIIEQINTFAEINSGNYTFFEPFVGGGAIFLNLNHTNVVINDLNEELILSYRMIRDKPLKLMSKLDIHSNNYKSIENYYYQIRAIDRDIKEYRKLTDLDKAARTIFLNKTCYNGLYRVNLKGQFNTPEGKYKNPSLYNKKNIMSLSEYFNSNVKILNGDYRSSLIEVKSGDVIYVDPPYDYGENTGFTSYQKQGFTFQDFIELKKTMDEQIKKGAYVIISNNATDRVVDLFGQDPMYEVLFDLRKINTLRSINSKGNSRKTGKEVIIVGMPASFPQANDLEKIILLMCIEDSNKLKNSEFIRNLLKVDSHRQVQYYWMALRYLGLIRSNKDFSKKGMTLRALNENEMRVQLANIIIKENIFKEVYVQELKNIVLSNSQIEPMIRNIYPNLSDATIKRRSSTVRKWIDWCKKELL